MLGARRTRRTSGVVALGGLLAYLDNAATTPVLPEAAEAVLAAMGGGRDLDSGLFANPSSVHRWGLAAAERLAEARRALAALLGGQEPDTVFTSGGTEANHLAIRGLCRARRRVGRHLITTAIEHHSVLAACDSLQSDGWEVTRLPVGPDGRVSAAAVAAAVRPDTVLCALGHVNNEIGTVQPVAEIAAALHRASAGRAALHVDGVQALGKVPTPYAAWGVESAAVSGHKIGGPKGVGALRVAPGVRLLPEVAGEQERGLRPGTENVPGIAGFGAAARLAARWAPGLWALKRRLLEGLRGALPDLAVNGPDPLDPERSAPHILSLSFAEVAPGLPAEVLLHAFEAEGIACSAGSACTARRPEPSHVLRAMGLPPGRLRGSLRLSVGPRTTESEIDHAVARIPLAVARVVRAGSR